MPLGAGVDGMLCMLIASRLLRMALDSARKLPLVKHCCIDLVGFDSTCLCRVNLPTLKDLSICLRLRIMVRLISFLILATRRADTTTACGSLLHDLTTKWQYRLWVVVLRLLAVLLSTMTLAGV